MDVQTLNQISIPPSIQPDPNSQISTPEPSSKRRSTCPFAALSPTPSPPSGHPPPPRRCPRWVRVLRFSAKMVAKQVIMRTVKRAVKGIFASLRDKRTVSAIEDGGIALTTK